MRRSGRPARALPCFLIAAAVWFVLPESAFLQAGPRTGRDARRVAVRGTDPDVTEMVRAQEKALDEALYPPELMWKVSPDNMVLRETLRGARDFEGVFWALVQPAASLAFLIVGLSLYFGENLVDKTPFTKEYLYFLKPTSDMQFFPQGAFMTFYGFFGFFLFGPLQWFLTGSNKGSGVAEFNKFTRRVTVVRDGELLNDMDFDDIQQVVLEYSEGTPFGAREVFIVDKKNNEIHFMDTTDDLPKRVLEKRASILAEFLDKDLEIMD